MHVLIIGSGAREHAFAAAIGRSPRLSRLSVAPGNVGTEPHNVSLDVSDLVSVVDWCLAEQVDLVVVGPEVPLVAGVADRLTAAGIACFGPSAAAAQLEGSKGFAREFAERFGIPSLQHRSFRQTADALAWIADAPFDVVVKADGLAAGKGVVVPESQAETEAAITDMLDNHAFGESSATILLEERVYGEELSLFGITDGTTLRVIGAAQDHKRVGEGDTGPNTGGMGAFSPVPGIDGRVEAALSAQFLEPVVRGMAELGTPYVGVIFAGIMLTDEGPRLIEYNCRFGDPEAQTLLPRLETDLLDIVHAAANGGLDNIEVAVSPATAATVVVCAEGYPASPTKGVPVPDIGDTDQVTLFHAGTARSDGAVVSSGGRVMAVTGVGPDLETALGRSYDVVDELVGDGLFARRDIGWRHAPRSVGTP